MEFNYRTIIATLVSLALLVVGSCSVLYSESDVSEPIITIGEAQLTSTTIIVSNTTIKTLSQSPFCFNLDAGADLDADEISAINSIYASGQTPCVRIKIHTTDITNQAGACGTALCGHTESQVDDAIANGWNMIFLSEGTNSWNRDTDNNPWNCGGAGTDCPPSDMNTYFISVFNYMNTTLFSGSITSYYSKIIGYDPGNEMYNPSFWLSGYARCSTSAVSFYYSMFDNATAVFADKSSSNIKVFLPSMSYDCIDDYGPTIFARYPSGITDIDLHIYPLSNSSSPAAVEGTSNNAFHSLNTYLNKWTNECVSGGADYCTTANLHFNEYNIDGNFQWPHDIIVAHTDEYSALLTQANIALLQTPNVKQGALYVMSWPYSCWSSTVGLAWEIYGDTGNCGAPVYTDAYNDTGRLLDCFQSGVRVVSASSNQDQVFSVWGDAANSSICGVVTNYEADTASVTLSFSTHNITNVTDVETGTTYTVSGGSVSVGNFARNESRFFLANVGASQAGGGGGSGGACPNDYVGDRLRCTTSGCFFVTNTSCQYTAARNNQQITCTIGGCS